MSGALREFMRKATALTRAGRLKEATQAIQQALGVGSGSARDDRAQQPRSPPARAGDNAKVVEGQVIDGEKIDTADVRMLPDVRPHGEASSAADVTDKRDPPDARDAPARGEPGEGRFAAAKFSVDGQTRRYKLYSPDDTASELRPLIVMLHGCTQDADDFAAGTAMNEAARAGRFFVLYPEQPQTANASRCWNWFEDAHQRRGAGEPAFIAGLTAAMIGAHHIDPTRVYVAGLSAGGAMATIVANAYPDLFAAVGVHSGLVPGAASGMAGAFGAMKRGAPVKAGASSHGMGPSGRVPTIVFHGDRDKTVHPLNGEQIIRAAVDPARSGDAKTVRVTPGEHDRETRRAFSRTVHRDDAGVPIAEHWIVHGAGHAWSGGRRAGTFTDPDGPDSTREMVRFFLSHRSAPKSAG